MFKKGKIYKRSKIHDEYGGQRQGGISTPKDYSAIFIITSEKGKDYGYEDEWIDDEKFLYYGEGTEGDMEFTRGNKAIKNHLDDNKSIYLFKNIGNGYLRYIDEMVYIEHKIDKGKDKYNNLRKVIIFELIRIDCFEDDYTVEEDVELEDEQSLAQLRDKAIADSKPVSNVSERKAKVRERSKHIKKYALERANGICEQCQEKAPFIKKNEKPYLEVHHIKKLSDSGPDHPEWVAAVCPNCHKEAHYGKEKESFNNDLIKKIEEIEGL